MEIQVSVTKYYVTERLSVEYKPIPFLQIDML